MNMRVIVNKYLNPSPNLTVDYSSKGGRKMIGSDLIRRNLVAQHNQ
jgi:hypothetical protein